MDDLEQLTHVIAMQLSWICPGKDFNSDVLLLLSRTPSLCPDGRWHPLPGGEGWEDADSVLRKWIEIKGF